VTDRPALAGDAAPAAGGGRWTRALRLALAQAFLAERERWILWVPVGLAIGIAIYFSLTIEPPLRLALGLVGAALGLLYLVRKRPAAALVATGGLVIALGFAAAGLRATMVAAPVLERPIARATVIGRIASIAARADGQRLVIERPRIAGLEPRATPKRLRINLRPAVPALVPGDWVRLHAGLEPPPRPVAPGAFDFARAAYFAGIGAVGFARGAPRVIAPPADEEASAFRAAFAAFRHAIGARLRAGLPGDGGAIAAALLIGDRGAISQETLDAMRNAGLAHLLAISGLHLGLVAGILFLGLRGALALVEPLALRYPIKKWAALAALCGTLLYLFLSGATIPTQRAFLMSGLFVLAVLCDRTGAGMRAVAWTATIVLLIEPESLLGPSFQMSFAAVTALVATYESLGRDLHARAARDRPLVRLGGYFVGIALVTLVAGLATAPFAIYHFNRVASFGLAANLIAVPLTALWIMPLGLAALVLMPFGGESLALVPMGWGIDEVIAVARAVSAWPGALRLVPAMPTTALAFAAGGGLWLCLWRGRWRWAGVLPIALALTAPAIAPRPDILIDERGKLFAVRAAGGDLALSTHAAARFAAGIWLRRDGAGEAAPWSDDDARLRCDRLGCIYRAKGVVVALDRDGRAAAEDCRTADLVISATTRLPRPCPAALAAIDSRDLRCSGAQAIYLDAGRAGLWRQAWGDARAIRIETVAEGRGRRPWARPGGRDCARAARALR